MKKRNHSQQVHIRCDATTRKNWLAICELTNSSTQSHLFKKLVQMLHNLMNNEKDHE